MSSTPMLDPGLTAGARARLDGMRELAGRVRWLLVLRGAYELVKLLAISVLASFLLDRLLSFEVSTRALLSLGAFGWLAWRFETRLLRPSLQRVSELELAAGFDRLRGEPGGAGPLLPCVARLSAMLVQVPEDEEERALLDAAGRQALERYDRLAPAQTLDQEAAKKRVFSMAGIGLGFLLVALIFPSSAATWASRWLLWSDVRWPHGVHLELAGLRDGRMFLPRGEANELRARANPETSTEFPEEIELSWDAGEVEGQERMARFADNDFRFELPGLQEDGRLWLRGGDDRLGPVPLLVRNRPRILGYELTAVLEAADWREELSFANQEGDLAFLEGTEIRLEVTGSEPLEELQVETGSSYAPLVERTSPKSFALSWTHTARMALRLELVSAESGLTSPTHSLTLDRARDSVPRVTLARRGVRERVTPVARVPLTIGARDDRGLGRVAAACRVGERATLEQAPRRWEQELYEAPAEPPSLDIELAHELALGELALVPGDWVQLEAWGTDRAHTGEQSADARPVLLRVVEPDELLSEILARLAETRASFRIARDDARELFYELEREPSGAEVERLRRLRLGDRTAWTTERTVLSSLEELELNGLVEARAELLVRERVLEPLAVLRADALAVQRLEMERAASGVEVARDALVARQGEIADAMDSILAGMEQWDSFYDLVQQLDELIDLQRRLRGDVLDRTGG